MCTVKIGKREIEKEIFIQAVATNDSLTHIIEAIGFNPIPTTTRWAVTDLIEELKLDTSHIKAKKVIHQETYENQVKQFNLSEDNKQYLDSFLPTIAEKSAATYKSSCGNFLELLGSQDFITVTKEQILAFAATKNTEAMKKNVEAHLRSMMIFCVNNDINGAIEKVDKQMLLWLIRK